MPSLTIVSHELNSQRKNALTSRRDREDLVAELRRQEVVPHLVAVVHRPRRVEPHRHRLGADRERAHEDVEPLERGLQVHHPLARLVVARAQLVGRPDARDADPLAAVERLHEERVPDVLADRLEVERRVVALGGRLEALVRRRHLVRDQPRVGHADPEAHQRAVGGVLLHRLERERVVQQVHVVHQRDLLQPRARQVVPPREPVDHERVARPVAEVERLVDDPLGAQRVAVDRAEPRDERLERRGPVLLGAEEQADRVLSHRASQEPRQMMRELAPPGRPVVRHVVSPKIDLVANALLAEQRTEPTASSRARRSCPPTGPGRRRARSTPASAASRDGRRAGA